MPTAFRVFPETGVTALFVEADGGGDAEDIDSLRNRPAKFPEDWLPNILFHSDLDPMEISLFEENIDISHPLVAASSNPANTAGGGPFGWSTVYSDHLIATHDLGYVPYALVAFDDVMLSPGMPVQSDASGGLRLCVPYCTTTEVRMKVFASAGQSALAAVVNSYSVMVFKDPPGASGNVLFKVSPSEGTFTMGRGKIDFNRRYLQVVDGSSPFAISNGETVGLDNGAPRFVRADSSTYEPVPTLTFIINPYINYSPGPAINYGGSFVDGGAFNVGIESPNPSGDSGFFFDPVAKTLRITKGNKTIMTSDGTLVNLLPTRFGTTDAPEASVASFPDFSKGYSYRASFNSNWNGSITGAQYIWNSTGAVTFTRLAGEWTADTVLTAAPTGADFFFGLVKLSRSQAPSHTWNGQTVNAFAGDGLWVPATGTYFVETEVPFSRTITFLIEGGNLIMRMRQSLGGPVGGYGASGDTYARTFKDTSGINHSASPTAGWPVWASGGSPYVKSSGGVVGNGNLNSYTKRHWIGGTDQCSLSDPTNYASTYQVEIAGQFGRRS